MKTWMAAAATLLATTALAGSGGSKAHETRMMKEANEQRQSEQSTDVHAQAVEQQLSGKVIKVAGNNVTIEHMGAAVPLQLEKSTQFEGGLQSKQDIQQGEEITATIKLKSAQNIVTKVSGSEETGVGGSGPSDEQNQSSSQSDQDSIDVPQGPEQQPIY